MIIGVFRARLKLGMRPAFDRLYREVSAPLVRAQPSCLTTTTRIPRLRPSLALLTLLVLVTSTGIGACASGPSAGGGPRAAATLSPNAPAPSQDRLDRLAHQALGAASGRVETTYDARAHALALIATIEGVVPRTPTEIAAAQQRAKALCFQAQRTTWTSGIALSRVTVTILGPMLDDYADIINGPYGAAALDAPTAAHFDWTRLSADAAWDRYNSAYLPPAYAPNQHFSAPTAVPRRLAPGPCPCWRLSPALPSAGQRHPYLHAAGE